MLAKGFTPNMNPSLLGWYIADLISGNDGDAIGSWSRAPGTPGTPPSWTASSTAQPTLKRNIMNGHSVLRFDGTANVMRSTYVAPSTAFTWLIAFNMRRTPAPLDQILAFQSASSGGNNYFFINSFGAPYTNYDWRNESTAAGAGVGIADASDTNPHVLGTTYNNGTNTSPGSYTAILDGTIKTVVSSSTATRGTTDRTALGAYDNSSDVASFFAQVDIAEIMWFGSQLSTYDLSVASKYLTNKYGL